MQQGTQGQQQTQQDRQARVQLTPEDWVWVGYDFDRDGQFDAYEYVASYDLNIAREGSAQRMQQQGMQGARQDSRQMPAYYEETPSKQQMRQMTRQMTPKDLDKVQGQIKGMKTISVARLNEQHVLAKLQTQDGRIARVDLGPKQQVKNIDLQRGDQITIFGNRGTINDQTVLVAHSIQHNGRFVDISRANDLDLKRFSATVLDTKTVSFQNRNIPQQLFARVRLDNNQTTVVNLGPQKDFSNIDLERGDKISMLARPANIDGKLALVAEQVRANGQVVDISRSTAQTQQSQGQQQSKGQQQSSGQQQ
jgi:hypothetical protein